LDGKARPILVTISAFLEERVHVSQSIEKLDANFAARKVEGGVTWIDIREFGVEGRGLADVENFYDRWPARAKGKVPENLWTLGQRSAGMCVRFLTDARMINARWTLRFEGRAMDHMPATGVSGLDLYTRVGGPAGKWRWLGMGWPSKFPANEARLISGELDRGIGGTGMGGLREMMLYLPLYNGVTRVEIGVQEGATVKKASAWTGARERAICFYGTSILHGGCASRPGMAYPAQISRMLDWPHVNLGFSGGAKCEPEVAELLAELDPAVYVVDPLPKMTFELVEERLERFVRVLRAARPGTPIVLVESIAYCDSYAVASRRERYLASNRSLNGIFEKLVGGGMKGLHLVPGEGLLGEDGEGTVDGVHPTDLGFWRMSQVIGGVVGRVLRG
jgi:hypothetical protein